MALSETSLHGLAHDPFPASIRVARRFVGSLHIESASAVCDAVLVSEPVSNTAQQAGSAYARCQQ